MESFDAHSVTDNALIARAAQGDGDARVALVKRLRKLHWVGYDDEARALTRKARAQLPNLPVIPSQVRETD